MKKYILLTLIFFGLAFVKLNAQEKLSVISIRGNLYLDRTYPLYTSSMPGKYYYQKNNALYFRPSIILSKKKLNFWEIELPFLNRHKERIISIKYPLQKAEDGVFEGSDSTINHTNLKYFLAGFKYSYNISLLKKSKKIFFTFGFQNTLSYGRSNVKDHVEFYLTSDKKLLDDVIINRNFKTIQCGIGIINQGGYHINNHLTASYTIPYQPVELAFTWFNIHNSQVPLRQKGFDFEPFIDKTAFNKIILSLAYNF